MTLENKQLGAYRLISLVGRGGMAQVWLANQLNLNREVAIKLLRDNPDQDGEGLMTERFAREARSVARLDHPNILPVIDYGTADGWLYLVMPYIKGGSLQERLKREPLTRAQSFDIFEQVLNGLTFAHHQGIIHRDLKPANILLYPDGRAVIADFGVAKALDEDIRLTQTGLTVGSPEYMAPEQFMGRSEFRSDLYSMGVILYRLMTARALYAGTNTWEIGMRHMNDPIPLPDPSVPLPIEVFLKKALNKRPEERFANAEEMGAALHRAISQLPPHELQFRPQRPGVSVQAPLTGNAPAQLPSDVTMPLPTPSEIRVPLPPSPMPPTQPAAPPPQNRAVRPPMPPRPEAPAPVMASNPNPPTGVQNWTVGPPPNQVVSSNVGPPPNMAVPQVAFGSPAPKKAGLPWLLIGLGGLVVVAGLVGLLVVLSGGSSTPGAATATNAPIAGNSVTAAVTTAPTSGNTTAASNTASVAGNTTSAPTTTQAVTTSPPVATTVASSPTPATPLSRVNLVGHSAPVNAITWSKDGKFFATASDDKTLKIWDAATNKPTVTLDDKKQPNTDRVTGVVWTSDGQQLVAAAADKHVRFYDIRTGAVLVQASDGIVPKALAIAPDDSLIPYPGAGLLHVWNLKKDDNGPDFALGAPKAEVNALAFSPDSKFLAGGLNDDRVLIWDSASSKLILTISPKAGPDPVTALAWTPDGKQLVVGREKTLTTFTLNLAGGSTTGQPISGGSKAPISLLAVSADGKRLAVGSQNGDMELWSLENNQRLSGFSTGNTPIIGLRWSADNKQLTVGTGGAQPALLTFDAAPVIATKASLKVPIVAQNGTKVSGTGVITDNGNGTVTVVLTMTGLEAGPHKAHIHEGTCQNQGAIVFDLTGMEVGSDGKATSTTIVNTDFASLTTGKFYLNVHNQTGTPTYVASCGEITT